MHGRRDWMELDERKEKILKAIIQNYLETGEPVVAKWIATSIACHNMLRIK